MKMMKKTIFSTLILALLALALLSTCDVTPNAAVEEELPDVLYSKDWRYITIYLVGPNAPISVKTSQRTTGYSTGRPTGRAMTTDTAKWGFDFFEVVFYYKGTSVRYSWEIGRRADVKDVYRTANGIDYSATSLQENSTACAVLFAGRGGDRTLLGMGKIVLVDGEHTTVVKETSTAVTFELSALTAAVSAVAAESSFLTNNPAIADSKVASENTKVIEAVFGANRFPLFVVPCRKITKAAYTLGIEGKKDIYYTGDPSELEGMNNGTDLAEGEEAVDPDSIEVGAVIGTGSYTWDDFMGSIRVAAAGTTLKRQARYSAGGDFYWYPRCFEDTTTKVNMTNNQTLNEVLNNTIEFDIDTMKTFNAADPTDNGLFSFIFTIPVYAITEPVVTPTKPAEDPWIIRPLFQMYTYSIDDGKTGNGGAVLIGAGIAGYDYMLPVDRR